MNVTLVGIGNVGGALAIGLAHAGYNVDQLIVRSKKTATRIKRKFDLSAPISTWEKVRKVDSSCVIICTDDFEIENAAERLKPFLSKTQVVLHTSGSRSSDVLANLALIGCETGSMHPLVSISDPMIGTGRFKGVYFCVEGSKKAVYRARRIARDVGALTFTVPTNKKSLYHASAVTAAGHMVALFDSAVDMLHSCGVSRNEAAKVLLPLTKSTVENLAIQSPVKALTGTFARLDVVGLGKHLEALEKIPSELREVYMVLGVQSLVLLEENGVKDPRVNEMRRMIFMAKGKRR